MYFQFKNTYKKYFAVQYSTHGIYLGCFYKNKYKKDINMFSWNNKNKNNFESFRIRCIKYILIIWYFLMYPFFSVPH
jgi:hypothetical protein